MACDCPFAVPGCQGLLAVRKTQIGVCLGQAVTRNLKMPSCLVKEKKKKKKGRKENIDAGIVPKSPLLDLGEFAFE